MATTQLERTPGGDPAGDGARAAAGPPPRGSRRGERWPVAAAVGHFMLLSFVAVLLLGVGGLIVQRHLAEENAVREAQTKAEIFGRDIAAPLMVGAPLDANPALMAQLDRLVQRQIASGNAVRVKVWSADGRILYSDDPRLRGRAFPLADDQREALETRRTVAEVSDLSAGENLFEAGSFGRLLEVYVPIRTSRGEELLFEVYFPFDEVVVDSRRIWESFAPVLIAAVLLLWATQVPLALSMARRLRTEQRERERLMRDRIDTAERERRRIASDLHDGVVQDLAGAAMSLSAARNGVRSRPPEQLERFLDESVDTIHDAMRDLRDLIVAISPPPMRGRGLPDALTDLAARLQEDGISATVTVDDDPRLTETTERLLHRCALEATRNILRHAAAGNVTFSLRAHRDGVTLTIHDDGLGFTDADRASARADGHVGLDLLSALVADGEGRLAVSSLAGEGTIVRITVPHT